MKIKLNSQNVFEYLFEHKILDKSISQSAVKVEAIAAKNFNLLLSLPDSKKFLIKQERVNQVGKVQNEFLYEWQMQDLIEHFPELNYLQVYLRKLIHYDQDNAILVFDYLDNYQDLNEFYSDQNIFSQEIASQVGKLIATVHRATYNQQKYRDFLAQYPQNIYSNPVHYLINKLERVTPEVFAIAPPDALKFLAFYQRYEILGKEVTELANSLHPCCLIHNDLKLNNLLLAHDWETANANAIRLIDWERSTWGDPALDLGKLIGSYLLIWLNSLLFSQSLTIEQSLRLANTPLEKIQPSIAALTQAYLQEFPEILVDRPNFIPQLIQCAGFALIQQIRVMLHYQSTFDNTGICLLQVAKSLLCRPEQSIPTIFGNAARTFINQPAIA
ncbi:phosphotransferase [Nostoc sp. CMAA1605]|uniref:phosphotransferase n=1 Tax=Nostoc sp. CMAA1605 TaxID=2055159 RepID=UPI001F1A9EE2|nr:phosphotransferase [Nostoc sp. CMAA1605]MCF4970029.1 LPS biosynthesis choline kinase [Nostoc sp. CMAA1605]